MNVKVRKSAGNEWGMLETYKIYSYGDCVRIRLTTIVTPDGRFAEPFVFRGDEFIPASQIDGEMGLEKYTKAKKPFYVKLQDGFIVYMDAGYSFSTGEFLPEKSHSSIMKVVSRSLSTSDGSLGLSQVLEMPEQVVKLMVELSKELVGYGADRLEFMKSRFTDHEEVEE